MIDLLLACVLLPSAELPRSGIHPPTHPAGTRVSSTERAEPAGVGGVPSADRGEPGGAHTGSPADTLRLAEILATVTDADPRSAQPALHGDATDLRLQNFRAEWYPRITFQAEATYQTDVPTVSLGDGGTGGGGGLPGGGFSVPTPPKDRYEIAAEVEQLVYDGGRIGRREAVERASLAERTAETRSALYGLREELNGAFFTALLQQERTAQIELLIEDLDARIDLVAARVREGAALRSELAALEAERIRAGQEMDAAAEDRRAALDRLGLLMDREIADDEILAVPDLPPLPDASLLREGPEPPPDHAAAPADRIFAERPEWQRMESTRARIRTEAALADAEDHPRISLFARGAYGRPGLDFFGDDFSPYATVGARLRWSALEWGSSERRAEALELQARIVETERAAFAGALRRRTTSALHDIDRLEATLESDEEVVALREEIELTARRQLEEGVLLPSQYVDTRTDLFEARLTTRVHRIQLAEARVRLRTLLGRDLSPEDLP